MACETPASLATSTDVTRRALANRASLVPPARDLIVSAASEPFIGVQAGSVGGGHSFQFWGRVLRGYLAALNSATG
ncbi:hypothetical protein GCM10009734_27210 [Nonomuraea bangladeshensis]